MTQIRTHIATVIAAGVVAAGGVAGVASGGVSGTESSPRAQDARPAALVIDASLASHGRELVDPRLDDVNADVRLPRDAGEARTNVRYFEALDYRVYVAGPQASAAAEQTGVDATEVDGLDGALAATR